MKLAAVYIVTLSRRSGEYTWVRKPIARLVLNSLNNLRLKSNIEFRIANRRKKT